MPDFLLSDQNILNSESLQQNLQIGTWESDPIENRLTWSKNLYEIFGLRPEDFDPNFEGYMQYIHPEDRERVLHEIQTAVSQKMAFNHQYRICRPSGEILWLKTVGDVVLDAQGEVRCVQGACQDITPLVKSHQNLQTYQINYQKLFQVTEDLILVHRLNTNQTDKQFFETVNPAVTRQLGWSATELLEMQPRDLIHEDDSSQLAVESESLRNHQDLVFNKWLRTRSGELKLYELHSHVFQEDGVSKVLTLGRSLEARQRRESEQQQIQLRLKALLELNQTPFANEQALIEVALSKAMLLTESELGYVYLMQVSDHPLLLGVKTAGEAEDLHFSWPAQPPESMAVFWTACAEEKQAVVHNTPEQIASLGSLPEQHQALHRHLCVPVLEQQQVCLLFGVGNKLEDYTEIDTRQLQLLAQHIWQLLIKLRATQKIRQQQATYHSLIQAMGEGVFMLNRAGQLLAYNPKAVEILGFEAIHLEQFNYRERNLFEQLQPVQANGQPFEFNKFPTEVTLETGKAAHHLVLGFRRPDGVRRWLKMHSEPVWDENTQNPEAVVVTFQDISEQRQYEKALADQSFQMRERLKEMRCLQQVSELASHNWSRLQDFYAGMIQLLPSAFRLPAQTHAQLKIDGESYRSHGYAENARQVLSVPVVWEEKTLGQLQIAVTYEEDPALMPEEIVLMNNLVTILLRTRDRLQSRHALESLNTQLENEVNARTAELTHAIRNLHGRVRELQLLNQVALLLQGDTPLAALREQLLHMINGSVITPDSGLRLRLLLESELAQADHSELCLPILVNGEQKACLCLITTEQKACVIQDNIKALLETLRHLLEQYLNRQQMQTSLILARQAAEQANQSKTLFLANMSHEIRTPMNAILGFSQLLREKVQEPQQKQYVETILNSGESLLRLINDILDLSKIEAGKLELHPQPVNLKHILTDIQTLMTLSFERKGLSFTLETDPEFPLWLELDGARVQQILLNLLSNALKFTFQGKVTLRAIYLPQDAGSGSLLLEVSDTGIGIAQEQQKRIFEAFEQVTAHNQGGTGLGLAIAYRLAVAMQAGLSVTSQPGQGSLFRLTFEKVSICPPPANQASAGPIGKPDFLPARIVIADDVDTNLLLIRNLLEPFPFAVYTARNGFEACELAEKHQPDLILMDIKMPVMNGIEAFEKLRQNPHTAGIPVVALTAFSLNQDEESLIKQGFDAYLRKPLEMDRFRHILKRFLPFKQDTLSGPGLGSSGPGVSDDLSGEALAGLRSQFVENILPHWNKVKSSYILDELESFCDNLASWMAPYDLPALQQALLTAKNQLLGLEMEAAQASLLGLINRVSELIEHANQQARPAD